ncbi:MAG: hypothetical protein CMP71_01550 [Flavobacteriales bacterium]|nr:hypothetical protein [Flavobacteriales bacterium]|tara:strand:+ start:19834 stop:20655 length:822 start_codon:yes stop_codon:yes gene_type:complete
MKFNFKQILENKLYSTHDYFFYLIKKLRVRFFKIGPPKKIIWIFGCQRSGTTFLQKIFEKDLNSKVHGEFSILTIGENKTMLKDKLEIKKIIENQNGKYIVIRSLFESDNAIELLDIFSNSIGVWVFRKSEEVVNSMIEKWNSKFFDISKKVESDLNGDWRIKKDLKFILDKFDENNLAESYGKYWALRNSIAIDKKYFDDDRFVFIDYESLSKKPKNEVSRIFKKDFNLQFKANFKIRIKDNRSKKNDIVFSEELSNNNKKIYNFLKIKSNC